jgi:hypothetical protein
MVVNISLKIVSLAPSATSILYELGARDHLVGVTRIVNSELQTRIYRGLSAFSRSLPRLAITRPSIRTVRMSFFAAAQNEHANLPPAPYTVAALQEVFENGSPLDVQL